MIKELILQNWVNVLVLVAFAILLKATVFLDRRTILRIDGNPIQYDTVYYCIYHLYAG